MKDEYDFSKGVRGKFFRAGAQLLAPVHLEPDVRDFLSSRAKAKGRTLDEIVNELLRKDIERIKAAS